MPHFLLKNDEFRRYVTRPELLRQEIEAEPVDPGLQIIIDEVQKVPALPAATFVQRLWGGVT